MTELWIDAHISPSIALWINQNYPSINAKSFRSLGLRDAKDIEIFNLAKKTNCILLSKDVDFQQLLQKFGPPPKLIWLTCGNTSNERLRTVFSFSLSKSIDLLNKGEASD